VRTEKDLAYSESRCADTEMRAEAETDKIASVVEGLRHQMESQLNDLRKGCLSIIEHLRMCTRMHAIMLACVCVCVCARARVRTLA